MFLRTLLSTLLWVTTYLANAAEDSHYNVINAGIGYNHQNQNIQRFYGTSWFINGSYQLPTYPIMINAGYAFSRVDKNPALKNIAINGASYFSGVSLLLKPTERLHITPSLTSGRLHNVMINTKDKITEKTNAFTLSFNAHYHLEKNLWLNSGIIHQHYIREIRRPKRKTSDYFTVGAEYFIDKDWGIGLNYRGNSEQFSTMMFVKCFF